MSDDDYWEDELWFWGRFPLATTGWLRSRLQRYRGLPGDFVLACGCVEYPDGGGVQWPCEAHRG